MTYRFDDPVWRAVLDAFCQDMGRRCPKLTVEQLERSGMRPWPLKPVTR
jgi:hypothetical protein